MIPPIGLDPNPNPVTRHNVSCMYHARELREIARAIQRLHGHTEVTAQLYAAAVFLDDDAKRPQPGQPDQL